MQVLVSSSEGLKKGIGSMSHKQQYEAGNLDYGNESFQSAERGESFQRRRPVMNKRRGKAPQSFNGMHRRRRRKMAW
jgi:hypothetical protein